MLYVLQNLFPLLEGSDFVLPEVVFRPYQRSATVNVSIIDDEIGEEVEDFTIYGNIVAPDHGLVKVSGTVTIEIIDDDCELKCDSSIRLQLSHSHMSECIILSPPTVYYTLTHAHMNVLDQMKGITGM